MGEREVSMWFEGRREGIPGRGLSAGDAVDRKRGIWGACVKNGERKFER